MEQQWSERWYKHWQTLRHKSAAGHIFFRRPDTTAAIGLEFGPEGLAIARKASAKSEGILSYCAFHPQTTATEQIELLRQLVNQHRWQGSPCHVVLHPAQYQSSMIEAPNNVDQAKLRDALQERLRDLFNTSPDQLAFDAALLPEETNRGHGRMAIVVAMARNDMEKIATNVSYAGLKLHSIDTTDAALRNLAMHIADAPKTTALSPGTPLPVALLRIRNSVSMLLINECDTPYLNRTIETGLESIRRQQADPVGSQRVLDTLTLEIQRSLDFFENQFRKGRVSQLYLLPTKQEITSLIDVLRNSLTVPVSLFPLEQLLPQGKTEPQQLAYCATAMGAALRRPES